ncbi:phosphate acyltransferase PlsX [Opitutus terrae]|uniref:Phosphate acyltransferase n=1 Tax=Opitutus terrae (strain DSM 11246 / JCM 15787 / PB90-1) TaxID=452637 RepID=B1ZWC5_OPITP|nr:phosphate acyltransferase PlsX [Opitutus terrae]ACB76877.1 fatty acid/phospholipid synthesis protein PlsX [Opitutus terrae PB90-1]
MGTTSGQTGRIAVDAMGGDLGPAEVVEAVRLALRQYPGLNPITLVGDRAVLEPLLARVRRRPEQLTIHHASEVVTMDDKPLMALKRKKDSSMVRAIELVKDGQASVVVSCGNTGALMAAGTLRLRTMEGVARPALAAVVPRQNGHFVLIDAGANPDAKPEHLVHNAILGSHYCRVMLGIARPRVGLMTIGTEEGKGNALITETNELLRRTTDLINYAGPIEGFHVFAEHVDVVVCDGFVGNIMIKSWESLVKFFSGMLREELQANPVRAVGALMSKGAFNALRERINPERYGGAPLLGLRGNILKAHGSSNRRAIKSAIHAASQIIRADMNQRIEADIARANDLLAVPVA